MSLKPITLFICALQVGFFLYVLFSTLPANPDPAGEAMSEGLVFFLGIAVLIFCVPALLVAMLTRFQGVGLIMSLVFPAGAVFLFLSGVA